MMRPTALFRCCPHAASTTTVATMRHISANPRLGHGLSRHQQSAKRAFSFTSLSPKNLADITNLPLLKQEPSEKIIEIWHKYHNSDAETMGAVSIKNDGVYGCVLASTEAQSIKDRAKKCPMIILPVFKEASDSYLVMLAQFQDRAFILTYLEGMAFFLWHGSEVRRPSGSFLEATSSLLSASHCRSSLCPFIISEYKRNPNTASPWLSVALYDDLAADKGITLIRSDFLPHLSKKVGAVHLATLHCVHSYYKRNNAHFIGLISCPSFSSLRRRRFSRK
jgi:ATP11 protein